MHFSKFPNRSRRDKLNSGRARSRSRSREYEGGRKSNVTTESMHNKNNKTNEFCKFPPTVIIYKFVIYIGRLRIESYIT